MQAGIVLTSKGILQMISNVGGSVSYHRTKLVDVASEVKLVLVHAHQIWYKKQTLMM